MKRLPPEFYTRSVFDVAPEILGKKIIRRFNDGAFSSFTITEIEMYSGIEDLGCHASKGRTKRTEVMFGPGGHVYVYLIYGMYWMLNIVTGNECEPQAILIRGSKEVSGPGRLGKALALDNSFYGENLTTSERIWIEDAPAIASFKKSPRIGIDYAGEYWSKVEWRYFI